jgi:hypothetical protein
LPPTPGGGSSFSPDPPPPSTPPGPAESPKPGLVVIQNACDAARGDVTPPVSQRFGPAE